MKKILTLLLVAVIFSSSFAQWRSSNNNNSNSNGTYSNNGRYGNSQNNGYQNCSLVVNAYSQNGYTVTIDNGATYQSNGNIVNVNSINAGSHTVTVTEYTRSILGKQRPRVIYNSVINFKQNIETTLNIDNNGQVNITERQLTGNNNNGNNGRGHKNKHKKEHNDNRNHDKEKKHGNDDNNDRDD
jgi:hypothetical protein